MKKQIRVAFWHTSFAPYRVPLFQRLAAYRDIDLTVYYGSEKDPARAWAVDFGVGYAYSVLPHATIPGYPYKFNYTLFQELLRKQYDVIIACENELGCQIAYLAAHWMRKPFIVWSVQIDYEIIRDAREYTFQGCLKRILPYMGRKLHHLIFSPLYYGAWYVKRHADACIAAGKKTEEHLRRLGATCPIFLYGNTIDLESLRRQVQAQDVTKLRKQFNIFNKTIILSVSYLQKRKGIQYLIEAFLQINPADAVLVIVGDGEYKQELQRLIPEPRTDILFVGHDEETAKYYAMADIFVMPSFSDPWGLTINEAMAAGLPVITTTNVGAQELIQNNGFLIPPRNTEALKHALEQLLSNPELQQEMGRRSLEIIKDYTIEHSAQACHAAIHAVAL